MHVETRIYTHTTHTYTPTKYTYIELKEMFNYYYYSTRCTFDNKIIEMQKRLNLTINDLLQMGEVKEK